MVVLVLGGMSQEQWTQLLTALLSVGKDVAMEIVTQTAGFGTIVAQPANAM